MTFKITDLKTPPEEEIKNPYTRIDQFTPYVYIGHKDGFGDSIYDKFDSYSVKNFKVSVASLKNQPILRLDTFDLYYGADHTKAGLSQIKTQSFSFSKGDGKFGSPYLGTPVRFQKIHFRGHKENGDVSEYYAIFLVSDPVEVTKKEIAGYGQYVNNQCEEIPENYQNACRTDQQEQSSNKASVKSWNDLSYIKGDSNTNPNVEMYKQRLIIGDALFSQIKNIKSYSPSSNNCHKEISQCSADSFPYEVLLRDKEDKTIVPFPIKELINLVFSEFTQKIAPKIVYEIIGQTAKFKTIECTPTSNGFNIKTSDGQVQIPCDCDCCDSEGQIQSLLNISGNIFNIPSGTNNIDKQISSILFSN